jgi:sugar lactone lactonase YvrE
MEVFDDRVAALGEGPFYDERTGQAGWVDVLGHRILLRDVRTGEVDELRAPDAVSAAIPRAGGGLVVLLPDGPALREPAGELGPAIPYERTSDEPLRCNDAKADPAGRLWFGTMTLDLAPGQGGLYRLVAGGVPELVERGVSVSNGLGWSPDGSRMYYVDTSTGRIDVFDYDLATGEATGRRPWVTPGPKAHPDGLCVDAAGGVWVALWGAAAVRRYAPDGTLDREVSVPTPYTTSCAFAGPDLDLLLITTAAVRKATGTPEAGLTYAHRPEGVVGRPVDRYAG